MTDFTQEQPATICQLFEEYAWTLSGLKAHVDSLVAQVQSYVPQSKIILGGLSVCVSY